MKLLVTVGSTLFSALTDAALDNSTLRLLASSGVDELVVQYGRAKLPSKLFQAGEVDKDGRGRVVFRVKALGQEEEGVTLVVRVLRFTDQLDELIGESNIVVSHAGSGTILQVLRTPKPLLVVPNTKLMDNHQVELATALAKEGYIQVCSPALEDLHSALKTLLSKSSNPAKAFPPVRTEAFRSVVDSAMGFT